MRVFVTVGTTRFDALVREVLKPDLLRALKSKGGYDAIAVQTGKSEVPVIPEIEGDSCSVTCFDYKPSLAEEIEAADLVISHAGAGTCLEVLERGKPLVVVVNDKLMNNHQLELAEKLSEEDYCRYCVPTSLQQTLEENRYFSKAEGDKSHKSVPDLRPFPAGNPKAFADFIDSLFLTSHIED